MRQWTILGWTCTTEDLAELLKSIRDTGAKSFACGDFSVEFPENLQPAPQVHQLTLDALQGLDPDHPVTKAALEKIESVAEGVVSDHADDFDDFDEDYDFAEG